MASAATAARPKTSPSAQHRAAAVASLAKEKAAKNAPERKPLAIEEHPTEVIAGEFGLWPNEVMDVLPDKTSGYAQDLMIRHVLRDTISRKRRTGSSASAMTRPLTFSALAKVGRLTGATGAKTAADIMRDAVARGLVARYTVTGELAPLTKAEESGLELLDKGGRPKGGQAQYCYRALWKNWELCPDHTPKRQKSDVEVVEDKDSALAETEVTTSLSAPRPLKPGAKFKGRIEPNTTDFEVRSKDVDGVGASVAKEGSRLLIVLSKTEVTTSLSANPKTQNKRVTVSDLREYLVPIFRDKHLTVDAALIERVAHELNDRPLLQFISTFRNELESLLSKKTKKLAPGFAVWVAQKCAVDEHAAAWDRAAAESQAIDVRATHRESEARAATDRRRQAETEAEAWIDQLDHGEYQRYAAVARKALLAQFRTLASEDKDKLDAMVRRRIKLDRVEELCRS